MDPKSVEMILVLICEGVGVANEVLDLARRVKAGEAITDGEINEARKAVAAACENWRQA